MSLNRLFFVFLGTCLLSACVWAPGQHMRSLPGVQDDGGRRISDDGQLELISITPKLVAQDVAARTGNGTYPAALVDYRPSDYRIGAGDILYITVWDHPELTVPAGPQQQADMAGRLVQSDGKLFYPYVGLIQAAGKTPVELRQVLAGQLARVIESPQVDVAVLSYASQRIWVTGAVQQPTQIALGMVPLTVGDVLSRAGFNPTQADLSGLRLTRDGATYTLDAGNAASAGLFLKSGDHLHIPFLDEKEVFVVGEVNDPGALNFKTGSISLSQALGRVGGLAQTTAKGNAVYVIRGVQRDLQVEPASIYQLEAKSPSAFAVASQFQLLPGDVVFVGAAGITRWNRFVSQLLPFASLINTGTDTSNDL